MVRHILRVVKDDNEAEKKTSHFCTVLNQAHKWKWNISHSCNEMNSVTDQFCGANTDHWDLDICTLYINSSVEIQYKVSEAINNKTDTYHSIIAKQSQ